MLNGSVIPPFPRHLQVPRQVEVFHDLNCTVLPELSAERAMLAAQVVPVGVDRAICEIITPVVERSVTIACMTTNELILKDFAFEPDDVRLLNVRM